MKLSELKARIDAIAAAGEDCEVLIRFCDRVDGLRVTSFAQVRSVNAAPWREAVTITAYSRELESWSEVELSGCCDGVGETTREAPRNRRCSATVTVD